MKFLILLCSLSFFGNAAIAQSINIVSTSPANRDFAVDTDSIVITFDQKMSADFFTDDSTGAGVFFFLTPEDSVQVTNLALSDDSLSVIYYVDLATNTDFIGFVVGAESITGMKLEDPYLFQFTTAPTRGEFVVKGTLDQNILEKILDNYPYEDLILALSPDPLLFGPGNDCDNEECEDDEITPNYAAFVDKLTGNYSVSGVREGSYFPIGLNFFSDNNEEGEDDEFFIPKFYFFDPDEDFIADSIAVNATTAPNDTLSDINLRIFELVPITFSEALELAEEAISELDNDPVIVGGGTQYASISNLDDGGEPDLSTQVFNKMISFHEDGHDDDGSGAIFDFFSDPNGENIIWEVYGYDAVKDSAFALSISLLGTEFNGYIGTEEAEFPDTVSFGDLEPLPAEFIDSDSAATIVEENGGWEFRDYFSGEYDFWEMELTALDNFWELAKDTIIANSPVMWTAEYYGFSYDPLSNFFEEGSFIIYIDIETGEVLYSDSDISDGPSTSHITFDEAVNIADSTTEGFLLDKDIMGGITRYTNTPVIFKGAKNEVPNSYQKMVSSAMLDHPESVQPDGNAYSWEIFVYDEDEDSVIVLNVSEFDVFISEKFSDDDLEDGVDFDDMLPLPFTHINSDSAAALIDAEGALDFRNSKEEAELEWYWEVELQLLHQYWDYPLDMTPSAPITWRAEYYAWAFDNDTFQLVEDSLTIYLDAETGEVLFSTVIVSNNEEPDAPEQFSLSQNYPNPFNPSTNIPFTLSEAAKVEISIYSILGQKVATIVNDLYPVGSHSIQWNAQNLASGVYIYRMKAGSFTQTKKLILLK